jgi:Putative beta-barrel porin 2
VSRSQLFAGARVLLALTGVAVCSSGIATAQRRPETKAPARSSWLASLTAEQGYDSNVRFFTADTADLVSRANGTVAVTRQGARGRLSVSLAGSTIYFADTRDLNANTYGVGLDGERRLSPRTTGRAGASYQTRLAADIGGLTSGQPLLRTAYQRSYGGTGALERRFTFNTTGRVDVGYSSVSFDNPSLLPGSALTGSARLSRQLARRGMLVVLSEVQEGRTQGVPLSVQSLGAGWEPRFGSIFGRLVLGATRAASGGPAKILPTGAAQLGDSLGGGALVAGYARSVSQAFGLGVLLTTSVASASYDFQAKRGNFVTIGGAWSNSGPSGGGVGTEFRTRTVSAGFRRVLSTGVTFGLGASYRDRKDLTEASGFGGQAQFGYTIGSR